MVPLTRIILGSKSEKVKNSEARKKLGILIKEECINLQNIKRAPASSF